MWDKIALAIQVHAFTCLVLCTESTVSTLSLSVAAGGTCAALQSAKTKLAVGAVGVTGGMVTKKVIEKARDEQPAPSNGSPDAK